ncbi:hypothetical protein SEVIR_9G239700v4 [Setaria viridis]|uniref:Phosphoglycerate kinase n=1 Tax=Setaria viridis TaxID=4556 RepID=A0A4U6T9E4_SETVI|nr:phosphoglycerate kinase-like [Setaria viridis]XP_034575571.1 phosphoglycerate kinase-like [Setaria viridis]XP_034575572.1 phosphoglycerate kinase-like [Setaria viridis]TKV93655.1 hypothetical protein SEVIR_9G239700v2 [Setaria viridis]TKV93656.1 hypothetical protein SEVIR_9G239700v2 [Setaria viridis]
MQACNFQLSSPMSLWLEPWLPSAGFQVATHSGYLSGGPGLSRLKCRVQCSQLGHSTSPVDNQKEKDRYSCIDQSTSYLHVQSLRNFPTEKLCGEVVVVRLDSALLLGHLGPCTFALERALLTIKYLYKARAKVVIVTSWDTLLQSDNPEIKSIDSFAEYLSSLLQVEVIPVDGAPGLTSFKKEEWVQNSIILFENLLNFRGEVANCNDFSQKLASGATIFVNDSFSLSHKILASTVGITRYCYASLAGFHFEEELTQLIKITDTMRRPYIAIIGGSNFLRKAPALRMLTSLCDGLFFVGKLSFQIMKGLGMPVPSQFIETNAVMEVLQIIQVARDRNVPIYYPTDLWCLNNDGGTLGVISSTGQLDGWTPADIGPSTLEKISSIIPLYKKILWIGPTNYDLAEEFSVGATRLGQILEKASFDSCEVILVGSAACKALKRETDSSSRYIEFQIATVVWEFLKGRILPGIAALDKRYPYQIPWSTVFCDPTLPLVVDIGSGNGLFLFQMAKSYESSNFLGLEMNEKLVIRCLQGMAWDEKRNLYFVATNATSTFHSIVSSYPGRLTLVTIQCPNPDFNKEQNRWRMVRRMLIEAVADLLQTNGQVYLQSDVESVLLGMKEQFLSYGKGQLVVDSDDCGHGMDNPFGVVSDWERHVLARGAPMYRTMLRKV